MGLRPSLLLLALLAACGGASAGKGPSYGRSPCVDNCGNDAQCQASCTDVSGPGGVPPVQ